MGSAVAFVYAVPRKELLAVPGSHSMRIAAKSGKGDTVKNLAE